MYFFINLNFKTKTALNTEHDLYENQPVQTSHFLS